MAILLLLAASGCGPNHSVTGDADSLTDADGDVSSEEMPTAECGNGILEVTEDCDDGDDNSDAVPDACRSDCTDPGCGDDVRDSEEECDSDDTGGLSCEDLGMGFTGGTLLCSDDCHLVTDHCLICGNGTLETGEECDGEIFYVSECEDLGYQPGGSLSCRDDCMLDTSGCCGDLMIGADEQCDDGNTVEWDGCNSCRIVEFQVNVHSDDLQGSPDVALHDDGSFLTVWDSLNQDGDRWGVFGRFYGTDGHPLGLDVQLNVDGTGGQGDVSAAAFSDGSYLTAWRNSLADDMNVIIRRFSNFGVPLSAEFAVDTDLSGDQGLPVAACSSTDKSIIVWLNEEPSEPSTSVFGQLFSNYTIPLGEEIQINAIPTSIDLYPDAKFLSDDNFIVVWTSYLLDGDGWGVIGRCFDSTGNALTGNIQINSTTLGDQLTPHVSLLNDENIVIVWFSHPTGSIESDVYARVLDRNCVPITSEFRVNSVSTGTQSEPCVSATNSSGFFVTWESDHDDYPWTDIYAIAFDALWEPTLSDYQIHSYTTNYQISPASASNASGQIVVVWSSKEQDGDSGGIFGQRYTPELTSLGQLLW
jgi:cysteine-rich repeat protein